jgi:DNA-binding Lrp family transcriptional regulator
MAKNSYKQMILDEKKIIDELLKNANKSINDIAKKCDFSRQKVWRIIKNLEKEKIIWGYTAVVDEEKLGLKHFYILVKRTNKPLEKKILERVLSGGEINKHAKKVGVTIRSSHYIFGNYDWLLSINARDIRDVKRFSELLNVNFEGFISELIILENLFSPLKCGINNPNEEKFFQLLNPLDK